MLKSETDEELKKHSTYITDHSDIKSLSESVVTNVVSKYPHVWSKATSSLFSIPQDASKSLMSGIESLQLRYFPDLSFWDKHRNRKVSWVGHKVKKLTLPNEAHLVSEAQDLSSKVRSLLHEEGIIFQSRIQCILDHPSFPWALPVLHRLKEDNLSVRDKVKILCYVTCLIILHNDMYVDYVKVLHLQDRLPLTIRQLQLRSVIGNTILRQLCGRQQLKLYRVHTNIPCVLRKVKDPPRGTPTTTAPSASEGTDPQDGNKSITPNDPPSVEPEDNHVRIRKIRHLPVHRTYKVWTPQELEILHRVHEEVHGNKTNKYREYVRLCRENGLPDRHYRTFVMKYNRTYSD